MRVLEREQHWNKNIGDGHAHQSEEHRPPPVAQPGTDAVEVLAAGADKAHAHIEAGNEEDTRQQDAAHGAEQQAHHIGEGLRPVGRVGSFSIIFCYL